MARDKPVFVWSFPCIYVQVYMILQLIGNEIWTRTLNSFKVIEARNVAQSCWDMSVDGNADADSHMDAEGTPINFLNVVEAN